MIKGAGNEIINNKASDSSLGKNSITETSNKSERIIVEEVSDVKNEKAFLGKIFGNFVNFFSGLSNGNKQNLSVDISQEDITSSQNIHTTKKKNQKTQALTEVPPHQRQQQ